MKDLWLWMYENGANGFSVSKERVQTNFSLNEHRTIYRVFTVPTQHFTVNKLSEITVERLDKEKARAEQDALETSRSLASQFARWAKEESV